MGRKKQEKLPGTEGAKYEDMEAAAVAYVGARDARMALMEDEAETKAALLAVMQEHGLTVYHADDAVPPFVVTVVTAEANVKVRQEKAEAPEVADQDSAP